MSGFKPNRIEHHAWWRHSQSRAAVAVTLLLSFTRPTAANTSAARHLSVSIRKRTSKELRQQLRLPKDARHEDGSLYRILVAISGGKDSAVLLTMMHDIIGPRRDVELISGCIDEGIDGYRAPSLECARQLAESLDVKIRDSKLRGDGLRAHG